MIVRLSILAMLVLPASTAWAQGAETYLEIPVVGSFGKEITTAGIEAALASAKEKGVKHVVFLVDSKGGRQSVGKEVNQVLRKHDKGFKFHAVISQATGVAVAVALWSDSIWVRPGAQIGGVNLAFEDTAGMEPSVILMNIALNAGDRAKEHGHPPELFRAMIDPDEPVYAWKDAAGKPAFGRSLPVGTAKEKVLLEHAAGKVLTLTAEQAVALGVARPLEGDASGIGKALGIAGWSSAGDAGKTAMVGATVAEERKVNEAKNDRERFLIDQNQKRREDTKAAVERFLDLANQWNPKAGTYSTYKEGGWELFSEGDGYDTGRLTTESRRVWRDRTDITLSALSKARQGVIEMRALEKQAVGMKQERMFPEAKLDNLQVDLTLKIDMLSKAREKRYIDDQKPK